MFCCANSGLAVLASHPSPSQTQGQVQSLAEQEETADLHLLEVEVYLVSEEHRGMDNFI